MRTTEKRKEAFRKNMSSMQTRKRKKKEEATEEYLKLLRGYWRDKTSDDRPESGKDNIIQVESRQSE